LVRDHHRREAAGLELLGVHVHVLEVSTRPTSSTPATPMLAGQLLDLSAAPVFDEAWRYEQVGTFAERKALTHRREQALQEEAAFHAQANTWSFGDPPADPLSTAYAGARSVAEECGGVECADR
jgi:hypothetical protein